MWQLVLGEEATDWSQETEPEVGQAQDWRPDEEKPPQEEPIEEQTVLLPARLWPEDDNEPVVYHHAGYRYKRTIDPARVVLGYLGDFGKDIPYLNRGEMMQAVRTSVRFCEQWLRYFVLRPRWGHFQRLQRNIRADTREHRYRDLLEYERYLRWNVEYRFTKIAVREVKAVLVTTWMPLDHFDIVLAYLF